MSHLCAAPSFDSAPVGSLGRPAGPQLALRRGIGLSLAVAAVAMQLAGSACMHRGPVAPVEAAPAAAVDRPEDLPRCGCRTPCAAHVEKSPCACRKAEPSSTES